MVSTEYTVWVLSDLKDIFGRNLQGDYSWSFTTALPDFDGDGIADDQDNCPSNSNPDQSDLDTDGIGDVCDTCTDADLDGWGRVGTVQVGCSIPGDDCDDTPANSSDADHDNICKDLDNCWFDSNPDQLDTDGDCPVTPYSSDPQCGDACDASF
jgi:hypothetical protein